ncbi:MAG: hypothetical protein OFPII_42220 [Osedax symbiont Rs1]|nr:MAG: hypothetical protein OFPII_42220 [Osedax symbiont Rs1]
MQLLNLLKLSALLDSRQVERSMMVNQVIFSAVLGISI